MKYVAYFRVKTLSPGKEDLYLNAQQKSVTDFVEQINASIEKEFCEPAGNKKGKYQELNLAIKYCEQENATLIIAHLGKLHRSLAFIIGLLASPVTFIALDNPEFTRASLPTLYDLLINTQKNISDKIKTRLKSLKESGAMLGRHGKKVLAKKNRKAANDFAKNMIPVIRELQVAGYNNVRTLTAELNRRQVPTFRGEHGQWHLRTVNLLLRRIDPVKFRTTPHPVKWVGGKRSIVKELKKLLPVTFRHYYEPFFGGGALFFELCSGLDKAFLSDTNQDLITMYQVIQSEPKGLIALLKKHQQLHNTQYYYQLRARNEQSDPVETAARMLYLNKTCYNGLWRVNQKGEFNTSFGAYANPLICNALTIKTCSKSLQGATIKLKDYRKITPKAGDFVYFDPPYYKTRDTSFTAYSKTGFSEKDHIRLAKFCMKLHSQGVQLMVSNSDTGLIRRLYASPVFNIHTVKAPRMINSNAMERQPVDELIITNY